MLEDLFKLYINLFVLNCFTVFCGMYTSLPLCNYSWWGLCYVVSFETTVCGSFSTKHMFYLNIPDSGLAECAHISLQLVNASFSVTTGWEERRRIDGLE